MAQAATLSVPQAGTVPVQVVSQKQPSCCSQVREVVDDEQGWRVPLHVVPLYVQPASSAQKD
jgi:hypothetical protein